MSKPLTENALATACPGNGLPNVAQSRIAHGRKTRNATAATAAMSPARARRSSPAMPAATMSQARPR